MSAAIKELELDKFSNLLKIAKTEKDWQRYIEYYLENPPKNKIKNQQRKMALENSWENKIEEISKLIQLDYKS